MLTTIEKVEDENPYESFEILPGGEDQSRQLDTQSGKIGWAILWLLGIPLPILIIAYLIWG